MIPATAAPGSWRLEVDKPPSGDGPEGGVVERVDADDELETERVLMCASCGFPIAKPRDRMSVQGSHQHTCMNPHGYFYTIGCFREAAGCARQGEESGEWSWFTGFAWQVGICGACGWHLGWSFRSGQARFWGLILERLVEAGG